MDTAGFTPDISYCFKYIGTIKPADGGGQRRLYIVLNSVQKKKLAVSEGGDLTGHYCTTNF